MTRLVLAVAFLMAMLATSTVAAPLERVYMAPSGNDANDGISPATAVQTLSRVHQIIVAAQPENNITVHIAPGTYAKQNVAWAYTMPRHSITFAGPAADLAVFDACAAPGDCAVSWFSLNQSNGQWSNLVFQDLTVQNYPGHAISFYGGMDNTDQTFNGRNRIERMRFIDIGASSTAIVRFVNSDQNLVADSQFVRGPGSVLLHAVYIAHDSDSAVLRNNIFRRISGDAVRIRDQSDNTLVTENRFIGSGSAAAGVSFWFCDSTWRTDCTRTECHNRGTIITANRWNGVNYSGIAAPLVAEVAEGPGPAECRLAPAPRFSEQDNILI